MPIEKYLKKLIYLCMEINKQRSTVRSSATEAIIDQGLRSYMLKVYNYMASGVLLTGVVALLFFKMSVVTSPEGQIVGLTNFGNSIYASGLKWVIMLAPLAVVFYMSFGIAKMSATKAQTTFWIFAALIISTKQILNLKSNFKSFGIVFLSFLIIAILSISFVMSRMNALPINHI